jgi:DNA-binding NarL/FixJ family response regulator
VPDSKTIQLLLVEDSFEDEQLLCEALLEIEENRLWCNWRCSSVVAVDRLAGALDYLRRGSFDAILLNLSLPDSPSLLDTFFDLRAGLDVSVCTAGTPILILSDEPDENLANRLLREGAQDVLVKSDLECVPLARAIRYAVERQRRAKAEQASAFVDRLTGALTREAFLNVAAHCGHQELLVVVEVTADREDPADREAMDPLLIQAAETLRRVFEAPAILGRWDRRQLCVLAPEEALHRAAGHLTDRGLQFSITRLEEMTGSGGSPPRAKTAMLAD